MHNRTPVPGSVAATFLSASIAAVGLGLIVFFRAPLIRFLDIAPTVGNIPGIWLFSTLLWLGMWVVAHLALRRRTALGSVQGWTWLFLAALAAGVLIAEASLGWGTLFE